MKSILSTALALALLVFVGGCSQSKLTTANYDQVSTGMKKTQVENILGKPTNIEVKDMIIFKKTTWRYEDGKKFAMITFKNDEVDGKETNLGRDR